MGVQRIDKKLRTDPSPVRRLLEFSDLNLQVIAGSTGLDRSISLPELNRPALELSGFFEKWKPDRIQIFGTGEMAYLASYQGHDDLKQNLERIFSSKPPCIIVTSNIPVGQDLKDLANSQGVTLFQTELHTTPLTKKLWDYLEQELSPYIVTRGVMMDIYNLGVLITGPSSIGKSETALELVQKGHTFVADDLIRIRGTQFSKLTAAGHSPVPYHLEIRGIGIIDISRMYGPRAVREIKQLDMVIELEDWASDKDYERLGIDQQTAKVLGVDIPCYTIPVKPGRNIATIVEVAIIDHKLRLSGVEMAKEFDEKLINIMLKRERR